MAMSTRLGVAMVALFLSGLLVAQGSPATTQRIASAKFAELGGRLADAEQELRAALAQSTEGERAQIIQALAAILMRQGRSEEAAALTGAKGTVHGLAPGEDPVHRLIAVLDSGAETSAAVKDASGQLLSLGTLVTPHLLTALPKLGPFGISNVLSLLRANDDQRIRTVLSGLVDAADPAVAATVAVRLRTLHRTVALPLAQKLAEARFPATVRCDALRAMIAHAPTDEPTRQLALQLAEDPTSAVQSALLNVFGEKAPPWAADMFAVMKERGPAETRVWAAYQWIQSQPGIDEERALKALLDIKAESWAFGSTAAQHPGWVRMGIAALRAASTSGDVEKAIQQMNLDSVEWWRAPDESAAALLSVPCRERPNAIAIADAIGGLVARGWRVPPQFDARWTEVCLGANDQSRWQRFVASLPADAEDRVLAAWAKLDPYQQSALAHAVVQAERPWHRLVGKQLLVATKSDQVNAAFLQRDWRGAPAEAIAALTELAARWPENPSGGQLQWHPALLGAFRRHDNLPISVILPLVAAGNEYAWREFADRDPKAALEHARSAVKRHEQEASRTAWLLSRHGGPADVPLALRVWAMHESGNANGDVPSLMAFFAQHASGHLDVIRLACVPIPVGPWQKTRVDIACQAAKGARVQDLAELLVLMPSLQSRCWNALVEALSPPAFVAQAAPWIGAVEACLAKPWTPTENESMTRGVGSNDVLHWLVWRLGGSQDPAALPVLRRVLASAEVEPNVIGQAAPAALQCAGPARRQLLLEMLSSPRLEIVRTALAVPEQRTDAELRDRTREAVLRLGETLDSVSSLFEAIDEPDRVALAIAVLECDRFARFTMDLGQAALNTLGRRKDVRYLPQFVRGASHPSSSVRCSAAAAIGNTFAREAAPHLLEMLKDGSDTVRKTAQKGLDDLANYLDERAKWEARLK